MMNNLEIRQMAVVVTYDCNLKCEYCFVSKKESAGTIDVQTVLRSVDMWKRFFSNGKTDLGILFTGGEPLLRWPTILTIIKELENHYPDISFAYHITTNGVLMTESLLPDIQNRPIFFCVSLDGEEIGSQERLHDSHVLFSAIEKNIVTFHQALGDDRFRVRMTVTPQNVHGFLAGVDYFVRLGIKNIHFSPNYEENWDDDSLSRYYDAFCQLRKFDGSGIIIEPFNSFRENGVDKLGPYEHDCSFLPTIDTSGNVYYCPRYAGKRIHRLGNVENPVEVLLGFRELVHSEHELFSRKQMSFICPSNYWENKESLANFEAFHRLYKKSFVCEST